MHSIDFPQATFLLLFISCVCVGFACHMIFFTGILLFAQAAAHGLESDVLMSKRQVNVKMQNEARLLILCQSP